MEQHQKPTKEQVREWLAEQVESKTPIPEPEEIRDRLWHTDEAQRRQVLS